jgi:homocysteine S-methyltransferase
MTELLAHGTVVLDGGLSNALEGRWHDWSSDLWTARLLRDDPGEIVAAHRAYFAARA